DLGGRVLVLRARQRARHLVGQLVDVVVDALAAQMIAESVVEDREQPALQALAVAQLRTLAHRLDQRVLNEVVGERAVMAPRVRDPIQRRAPVLELLAQRVVPEQQVARVHESGRRAEWPAYSTVAPSMPAAFRNAESAGRRE